MILLNFDLIIGGNKMMIKTMCGTLQQEMAINNMPEYRSGIRLNACIQASAYSLPQTKAVIYEADSTCQSFVIQYYNSTSCETKYLFRTDPPQVMDSTICVKDQYIYECGTIDDVSVNDYSGIMQYGYEDSICGTLDYFMQYGCKTDASECIDLEPFGAPDSAQVLCNGGNGTTISYAETYTCDTDAISSTRPVDTCSPFVPGIDDQFSQGNVYFTGTTTRMILCSHSSDDDQKELSSLGLGLIIAGSILFCALVFGLGYAIYTRKADDSIMKSEIENPVRN